MRASRLTLDGSAAGGGRAYHAGALRILSRTGSGHRVAWGRRIAWAACGFLSTSGALQAQVARERSGGDSVRLAAHEYVSAHQPTILHEFADLLALPNLATDSANIRKNADRVLTMLAQRGVNARLLEVAGAPPAVYGELKVPGARHTVLLYAHYDGQPVDTTEWLSRPWTPTLRGGSIAEGGVPVPFPTEAKPSIPAGARIYARSAGDDKASIMAMLVALDALHASGRHPSVNLKFLFEGEEEAGSTHLAQILDRNKDLLSADALVLGDGPEHQSGRQQLLFGVRGVTGLELIVYGASRPLHSGHYGNWAPNPGVMLANLIASMRDDDGRILIAGYYDDVRPISSAERQAIGAAPVVDSTLRRSLGLARSEANNALLAERIMAPALNLRGMRYGAVGEHAANAIGTEASASFDFRLVPNQTPEHVRELVNAHLRANGYFVTADSVTNEMRLAHARIARVRWDGGAYPASRAAMDSPVARAVIEAVTEGAGGAPVVLPTMGGSAPNYLFERALHLPVIILPIANYDDNQHAANENLRVANLWSGIEVYAALMARLGRVGWDQ